MKRILLVTVKAVVTLLIATPALAQETAEVPDIAELKNLIEEGLVRVYGQHYAYSRAAALLPTVWPRPSRQNMERPRATWC